LLLDAGVHAVDAAGMEGIDEVVIGDVVGRALQVDVHLDDLVVLSCENQSVFTA